MGCTRAIHNFILTNLNIKGSGSFVDDKKAKSATLRMNDKDGSYVAAVYFPDVSGGGVTKLTFICGR
jgi:hypothetical protein